MTTEVQTLDRSTGTADVAPVTGRVQRFTRTERGVHWTQATGFLVLLITGFVLALPQLEASIGHRALLREFHLTAAFLFAFGPTIVALAGDRASLGRDVRAVDVWDEDDLRWLLPFPLLRLAGIQTPPQGRFNAGQKLNAIFVAWSTLTFVVTGFILWQNRRFPTDVVSQSNTIHTLLAYLALAAFLGHVYLAAIYPRTRHSFRAMTQGWVRSDWAAEHHPKWLQSLDTARPTPRYDALRTGIQIVLGSAIALMASRILFFAIGANVTDRVTERLYAVTAWPGVASIAPQTGVRLGDWPAVGYLIALTIAWFAVDRLRTLRLTD
jgi:formate dehydrogenase subunit gamma